MLTRSIDIYATASESSQQFNPSHNPHSQSVYIQTLEGEQGFRGRVVFSNSDRDCFVIGDSLCFIEIRFVLKS